MSILPTWCYSGQSRPSPYSAIKIAASLRTENPIFDALKEVQPIRTFRLEFTMVVHEKRSWSKTGESCLKDPQ